MLSLLLACAEPDGVHAPADTATKDTSDDTGDKPVPEGCRATPLAADRERTAFVSLPYASAGNKADTWAKLSLSADGELGEPEVFDLARASEGELVFTPDASVGVAPLEDGTVTVITGAGDVIATTFDGGFYAGRVVGDRQEEEHTSLTSPGCWTRSWWSWRGAASERDRLPTLSARSCACRRASTPWWMSSPARTRARSSGSPVAT